ncbi:MerR family transcriptional regulator [Convivina intestini]|uniref:MerR family transcriptional regulator n=1 Tax=Convivina intestini TaxID=1505726 RepID=A0A2U1D693_9LACO|nr:MerR family transcriptional regulator [Convivina intestini]PVY83188.1 MerR family transcriptional regulator [Convivina intestini]CAH1856129.1 HTH-type transcriptional activator TipA [Convivina intestini]SDB96270.1 DNA-binding transcriptional regulator, MerR family [Leuconostocaceae bacterium R-53105]
MNQNNNYSISQLAQLTGVTTRTLRYYDKINLLKPEKIDQNGYRRYAKPQLDTLQQILYFKSLDFNLQKIKSILHDPTYNVVQALEIQRKLFKQVIEEKRQLLKSIDQSLKYYRGEITMTDQEQFETLKNNHIRQNDKRYGEQARTLYGNQEYEAVQKKMASLNTTDYQSLQQLENNIIHNLNLMNEKGLTLDHPLAQDIFQAHQKWLKLMNPNYTSQYHLAMADLYEADESFQAYYDSRTKDPSANLLIAIIRKYS